MLKSKNGDSAAFSILSKNIREIGYSYFLSKHRSKRIINLDDVDDLTNNVYLSFAEQYEKIDSIENWLRRVLFLTFVKWYKQSKLKHTSEISEYIAADNDYLKTENSFDVNAILEIVDTLSKEKQDIIKLRFWEELKFSEIAERFGKSEDAVKKIFYRTIEEIKKLLD